MPAPVVRGSKAGDRGLASGRPQDPQKGPEQCGLAGAVGADDHEYLARDDIDGESAENGPVRAIPDGKITELDLRGLGLHRRSCCRCQVGREDGEWIAGSRGRKGEVASSVLEVLGRL